MSPTSAASAVVRSAAAVNEDIRALLRATGGWLYAETRERYELLRAEWAVATAAEREQLGDAA